MKRPTPRHDYTQTLFYQTCFAVLSASAILMTWNSLPSIEAWLFVISFLTMLFLTYIDITNPDA